SDILTVITKYQIHQVPPLLFCSVEQHPCLLINQIPTHLFGIEYDIQIPAIFGLERYMDMFMSMANRLFIPFTYFLNLMHLAGPAHNADGLQPVGNAFILI